METKKLKWYGGKQIKTMIFAGLLFFVSTCMVANSTNSSVPVIANLYGWDASMMSMMVGIGLLIAVIFAIFFGRLIVRFGMKPVVFGALILGALSSLVYGLTSNFSLFLVCTVINAIACAGYQIVGVTTLINTWFPRTKGIVLGWVTMGIILSDVAWIGGVAKLMVSIGVKPVFIAMSVFMVLVALFGLIFIKNTPEEDKTYPDGDQSGMEDLEKTLKAFKEYQSPYTIGKTFKTKQAWQIIIGWGLLWLCAICYISQEVSRFMSIGYPLEFGQSIMGIAGIFGLIGSWLFGFLDQKLGTKKASTIYAIWFFLMMIFALLHSVSVVFCYISAFGISCCAGGICNLIPSMTGTIFGRWDFPAANSVINPCTFAMCAIGIFIGALLSSSLGFMVTYIIIMVLTVIAFIIIRCTKDEMIGRKLEL
ncbi:MAG: MFS transporter [Aeriscardovia sp.]|nr:MFS transporter [Aeriscardovia sp.]